MRLWRHATVINPYFGPRSCWALDREFADLFAAWNAQAWVQDHLDVGTGAGPRRLYTAEISLDDTVLDLRDTSLAVDFTPQEIEARIPTLTDRGIRWVLWFELPWEGRRWPQAMYLGTNPVPAIVAP